MSNQLKTSLTDERPGERSRIRQEDEQLGLLADINYEYAVSLHRDLPSICRVILDNSDVPEVVGLHIDHIESRLLCYRKLLEWIICQDILLCEQVEL